MNEPTMETLARRLDRVERGSRRLKWTIGMLAVGLLVTSFLLAIRVSNLAIETLTIKLKIGAVELPQPRYVTVKGEKGTVWLDSGLGIEGYGPRLTIYDNVGEGRSRVMLGLRNDSARLILFDNKGEGNARAVLRLNKDGEPSLTLYDEKAKGKAGAVLRLDKDGEPSLELYDEKGEMRAALGSVTLVITRPGPGGSKVEVEEKIPAGLVFFDKNGKVIWRAP